MWECERMYYQLKLTWIPHKTSKAILKLGLHRGEYMEHKCMRCGKTLKSDEIALYRKLIWREASEYLCIECLAGDLSSTPERLNQLIDYFRTKQKCCLFV